MQVRYRYVRYMCPRCGFPTQLGDEKCFICGYVFIEENNIEKHITHKEKMLNLPKLDYTGWTAPQQLRKIGEEFGEVSEAVAEGNPVRIIKESLDAIQTLNTLIHIVADDYNLNLDRFYREHEEKLRQKGYLKED